MPVLKHILFLSTTLALFACSQPARQVKTQVDWNEELLGFGNLFVHPDSSSKEVMFLPKMSYGRWGRELYDYSNSEIITSLDTIVLNATFVTFKFFDFLTIRDEKMCKYRINKLGTNLFMFSKIHGHEILAPVLFYQKFSTHLDDNFEYMFSSIRRSEGRNIRFIEILKSGLIVLYDSQLYDNFHRVLILHNPKDYHVVNQMIQYTIQNRLDTVKIVNFYGDVTEKYQFLVFDGQIFEHNHISKIDMLGPWLFAYFEHHPYWLELKDPDLIKKLMEKMPNGYSHYPVVIKAPEVWILPPPPPPLP